MGRHSNKCAYALEHAWPSLAGVAGLFLKKPLWAAKLLKARAAFFLTRTLREPMVTPDRFCIESSNELVAYWSFFVERECWAKEWADALAQDGDPLVLDVGANAGLFSHWIWTLRPHTQFIIFEPLPRMARKIERWKEATGASAVLHNVAVSDHTGSAVFFASEDNDPTASLKPEGKKGLQLTVPLVTLDSVIPSKPVLLMKVDVEGCECEVLAGARKTLERTRFLILEAHTEQALAKIQNELGSAWNSRRVGASDFLFMRR